jgi:hypothetical protein
MLHASLLCALRVLSCAVVVGLPALAGCGGPQEAPKDLDGLARFMFANFKPVTEDGAPKDVAVSDAELQDAFSKLHKVIKGDAITEGAHGVLGDIEKAQLDLVGVKRDPNEAQGMYITNVVHCSHDRLKEIILEPDQLSLYPEAYSVYERTLDADTVPYLPTWKTTYTSSDNALVTNQFTAHVVSGLRLVPPPAEGGFGEAFVNAAWMPKPAEFEDDGSEFTFDVQVETFHERKPGEFVHFYGLWRYMKLGILGDSYDQLFIDQTTQGMIDWDSKTDALCE